MNSASKRDNPILYERREVSSVELPLKGLVVVDLTRLLPGPMATMMLRDLGARVIKVETPSAPDLLRFVPPVVEEANPIFRKLNAGKESVALDLYSQAGASALRILANRADVVITSASDLWMEKRGIGLPSLRAENSQLVTCTLGSFSESSPYYGRGGHDVNFLAVSGMADLLGCGEQPGLPGVQLADLAGTQYAVARLLAALLQRERNGNGSHLDLSLEQGCGVYTLLAREISEHGVEAVGPLTGESPMYRYYRCADGKWVALGAIEPKFQALLKKVLPLETGHWPDELFFCTDVGVHKELESMFEKQSQAYWTEFFAESDLCFTPVLRVGEAEAPPLFDFGLEPGQVSGFGADSRRVLEEFGWSREEVEGLIETGVVVGEPD